MKKTLILATLCAAAVAPPSASAQIMVGPRASTLGVVGGEVVVAATRRFEVRGGVGIWTLTANTEFDGIPVDVSFPDLALNVGVDYYLNDTFRVGGGALFRASYPTLRGAYEGVVNVGGTPLTLTEVGILRGVVTSNKRAAYAVIGLGRPTGSGVGLSLDVGAAFLGNPSVSLTSEDGTFPEDELALLLAAEEEDFENDMKTYFRIWPILSISLRFVVH